MILLVHIVRTHGEDGDAVQFEQHANRQARNGDYLRVCGFGPSHPGRHRQRLAIGPPQDIVDLVVGVVHPDYWQTVCTQGMEGVIDRDFSKTLLMGSMSFSCLRR